MAFDREALRRRRREAGLSQEQLAAAVGVTASTVNRWERGHYVPHRTMQRAMDAALSASRSCPLGGAVEQVPAVAAGTPALIAPPGALVSCSRCRNLGRPHMRPVEMFYRNRQRKRGLGQWCKPCMEENRRALAQRRRQAYVALEAAAQPGEPPEIVAERRLTVKPSHMAAYQRQRTLLTRLLKAQRNLCANCGNMEGGRDSRGRLLRMTLVGNPGTRMLFAFCLACATAASNLRYSPDLAQRLVDNLRKMIVANTGHTEIALHVDEADDAEAPRDS